VDASWKWGLGAWAALRLLASAAGAFAVAFLDVGETVDVPGYRPPEAAPWASMWLRADALWYLKIAAQGYGAEGSEVGAFAFFPAFPMLTRLVTPAFGGNELYAALFVANAACALGFVACYSLFRRLGGDSSARAGVVALAVFPTSFFLVAPYAEPLLVASGAAALLAALKGRGPAAVLLGVVAALSRPFGVLLAIPLMGIGGRKRWWMGLGPVAGAAAWWGWVAWNTGELLGAVRVQTIWQRQIVFPPVTLLRGVREWLRLASQDLGLYFLLDLIAAVFAIALVVAVVVLLRRRGPGPRWGTAAYGAAVLLIPLAAPFPPRPLLSLPRFVLANFPGFAGAGLVPKGWRIPLAVLSAAGLLAATAAYVAAGPIF
jgi:hypothetical protein